MAAYVIVDIRVTDPVRYEEYRKLSGPALEAHGGRFVVRGGASETLEGDWSPGRIVVLEFDTMEQARRWYESEEYREAMRIRKASSQARMILVQGVGP